MDQPHGPGLRGFACRHKNLARQEVALVGRLVHHPRNGLSPSSPESVPRRTAY